ncbi:MAG: hypothetical protein IIA88_07095 [Bacteroidetes bacterium]|nr:hypothetical protein [Bacteroidota bacterium]
MKSLAPLEFSKFYHIYNRGNNKENIFLNDWNYAFFLKKFHEHISPIALIYVYCLIPNHFHFMIRIKDEEDILNLQKQNKLALKFWNKGRSEEKNLSQPFSNLFNSYSKSFNKVNNRTGKLFDLPFKRIEVNNDEYFTYLIHYIHRNPVHHGLCNNYDEWKYSSYNDIISNKFTKLCRNEVINWFGSLNEFINFHKVNLDYYKITKFIFE